MREEVVKMKDTYQCPAGGCDHPPLKTPQALRSHIRNIHLELLGNKSAAREVPIVEGDFTTAELVRGKHTDIMKEASYGAYDKLALTWLSASRTLLPPGHTLLLCRHFADKLFSTQWYNVAYPATKIAFRLG